jgi:predicted N-acyltransferase
LTFELIGDAAVKVEQAGSMNYRMRIVSDPAGIEADRWNALVANEPANPFVRHEFLHALHASGCAGEAAGWEPRFLTLWSGSELAAAAPLYRKHHSYGEYVFDWAWADAHARHGVPYYPKWLVAVPFTPVPGPRMLAVDAAARDALAVELQRYAETSGLSSLHALFLPEADARHLHALGHMTRRSVQFHWFNRRYTTFDDYLAALTQPKRKKVRAERRKVAEAGVTFVRKVGRDIGESDWAFFARCYARTYAAHHSTPYLTRAFFLELARSMPEALLLVVASRGGKPIASALALFDRERLYGRYWGAVETVPCLHFETSYYQMIEFAIERGLAVFEGGAQGEHKLARGFEPVTTWSSHWLAHPAFNAAVQRYLEREHGGIEAYVDELNERTALRPDAARAAADE